MRFTPHTAILAVALLAATPAAAQQPSGGRTGRPARPVDACGAPVERPRSQRPARPAPAHAGAPEASAGGQAHPGPALLGRPVDATASAASPRDTAGSSGGTAWNGPSSSPRTGAQPDGSTAGSSASIPAMGRTSGTHSHGGTAAASLAIPVPGGGIAHGGTPAAPGPMASSTSLEEPNGPASSSTAQAHGTAASSVAMEANGAPAGRDSTFSGTQPYGNLSSTAAPADTGEARQVNPRIARRNRELLRLGLQGPGAPIRLGPAASVSIPTAYGVDAGELFFGLAYQGRTRYTSRDDGAAVVGFGLGTRRVLAVEAALVTYSTVRDGGPLETGGISVKLHRAFPGNVSVAAGWENALRWGGSDDDGSLYLVGTRLLALRRDPSARFSTGVVTLGVGNGRFRFEDDDAENRKTVNLFGAVGVRVSAPLSLVADWTGQDLNMAASITPFRRVPLVVTAGAADLTGTAGDGVRFIMSVGYGLALRNPF